MPQNNDRPFAGNNPHQQLMPFGGDPGGAQQMPPGVPPMYPPAYQQYPAYQDENMYDYDYGYMTTEIPVTTDFMANLTKSQELEIIDNIARRVMGGPLRIKPTGPGEYVSYYDSMYQQYFEMLAKKRPRTRRRRSNLPKTYPPQLLNLSHYLYFNDYSELDYNPSFWTAHDYDSYYYIRTRTRPRNTTEPDYIFVYTRQMRTTKMTTLKRTRRRTIRKDIYLKALKGLSKKHQIVRFPNNTFAIIKEGNLAQGVAENFQIVVVNDTISLMPQGGSPQQIIQNPAAATVNENEKLKNSYSNNFSFHSKHPVDSNISEFGENNNYVSNKSDTELLAGMKLQLNEVRNFKRSENQESINFYTNRSLYENRKTYKFQRHNNGKLSSNQSSFFMQNKTNVINERNNIWSKNYHPTNIMRNKKPVNNHLNSTDQLHEYEKKISDYNSGSVHVKKTMPIMKQSNKLNAPQKTHSLEYENIKKAHANNDKTVLIGNNLKTGSILTSDLKRASNPIINQMKNNVNNNGYNTKKGFHAMTYQTNKSNKKKHKDKRSYHPVDMKSFQRYITKKRSFMGHRGSNNVEI